MRLYVFARRKLAGWQTSTPSNPGGKYPLPPMSLLLVCAHTDILVSLVVTALRAPDSGGAQTGGRGQIVNMVSVDCFPLLLRPSPSVPARCLRCCSAPHPEALALAEQRMRGEWWRGCRIGRVPYLPRRHTARIICSDSGSGWGVEMFRAPDSGGAQVGPL